MKFIPINDFCAMFFFSILEIFEHADIFFHHSPGNWQNVSKPKHHRARRDVFGWLKDRGEDAKAFVYNAIDNVKDAVDIRKHVASYLSPIEWTMQKDGASAGMNYEVDRDGKPRASGTFDVEVGDQKDVSFKPKENTWFKREKSVESPSSKLNYNSEIKSSLQCTSCYVYYKSALTL